MMLQALSIALQTAFTTRLEAEQKRLSAELVETFKLGEIIRADKEFDRDRVLLTALSGEKISTATALLTGLKGAIESFEREEMTTRSLATLKSDFLD